MGGTGTRACKLAILVRLKNFGVSTVIMGVACLVLRAIHIIIYIFLLRRGEGENMYGDYSHTFGASASYCKGRHMTFDDACAPSSASGLRKSWTLDWTGLWTGPLTGPWTAIWTKFWTHF